MRLLTPLLTLLALSSLAAAEAPSSPVDAGLSVVVEGAAGLQGGSHTGHSLEALSLAHLGWQAPESPSGGARWRAYVSVLNHEGRGPSQRFLGDFLAASNIEAFDSTRLYSWWAEVERADWSLRVGALLADEEFAGTDAGSQFASSVFGWPAFISANTVNTGPAFFVAAPGLRLAHPLTSSTTWRIGVYDGDTFDSAAGDPSVNRHGLHYQLGGTQGWFFITEIAYAPKDGATRVKLGTWHHTTTFTDEFADDSGRAFATTGRKPRHHSGDTGAYAALEHTLTGEAGKPGHIDGFFRLGGAPSDRNTLRWVVDTGAAWLGPLPGRPTDVAALGFAHADFSRRLAATTALLNPAAPRFDAEQVIEATYTFVLNEHFKLKPDLQFIRHPGGSAAQRDAVLAMLRMMADF